MKTTQISKQYPCTLRHLILFRFLPLVIFLLFQPVSRAQFFEYGQEPGTVKWNKIESLHFKVIYPEELNRDARKILVILEKNYAANSRELEQFPKKIPVILHTHTVRSNGFVVWAPKRMELFMFPDVNGIAQDWYTHLALHEYRHVIQVEKMNKGFTRFLTVLLGEQGVGPAAGLTPFWLLEGDAVYAETSLSESGRGRTPRFEMGIKAQLLEEEKPFSYSKAYLGSYKDYVPSYYEYGYQMVSYAREKHGDDIWAGAFSYIGKNPYLVNPLYFYLKKQGEGSKNRLYKNTSGYLEEHWSESIKNRIIDNYEPLSKVKNKLYTDYRSPRETSRNTIIAIKSNVKYPDRFVEIFPDGSEKLIFTPGYLNSTRFSYSNGKILWDEYQPGTRFRNQSYSILKEYNIETGTLRYISMNSRYTSPAYSSSGDTIVAIETTLSNDFNLVFISGLDAGIFTKVPSPGNIQLLDPSWIKNSDRILVTGLNEKGKSLLVYDRSEKKWSELLPPSPVDITRPVSDGKRIYFNGTYEGVDNIYAIEEGKDELYRISNSKFGAFDPEISAVTGNLYFTDYSADGYRAVKISPEELDPVVTGRLTVPEEQSFFHYRDTEQETVLNTQQEPEISEPVKYSRLGGLFRVHSWTPFYFDYTHPDIENPEVSPGITLLSQNLLSTAVSHLSYEYRDKKHFFHTGFTYRGWLPVIDISYHHGGDPLVYPALDSTIAVPATSPASRLDISTFMPLSFSMGRWTLGMQPLVRFSRTSSYFFYNDSREYKRGINYIDADFYLYFIDKPAMLDIIPRWGFVLDLRSLSAPFEKEQKGSISSFKSSIYIPGISRNHGIRLQNQWQWQNPETWLYSPLLSYPRGIPELFSENMYKFTADYYLPLFYPDWSLEGFLYLKRIRAELFYDYLYGTGVRTSNSAGELVIDNRAFASGGIELKFDYHLFRILFPLTSGFRFSYNLNSGKIVPELIYSIDLNTL